MMEALRVASSGTYRPTESAPTYNLFRRKPEQDLFCAVPVDRAVPPFVQADLWEFAGTVSRPAAGAPGFHAGAAAAAVRFNGYYLFQGLKVHRGAGAVWA